MSDKHTPNPLPCGCRVEGEPERAGWRIRRYVRHCPLHAAAPALLAACEAFLACPPRDRDDLSLELTAEAAVAAARGAGPLEAEDDEEGERR